MALPTTLTDFGWPTDGIGYMGPFISSVGNVYIVGVNTADASNASIAVWKATDPTSSFTKIATSNVGAAAFPCQALSATQLGDVLHIVTCATNQLCTRSFGFSTDSFSGFGGGVSSGAFGSLSGVVNGGAFSVVRSTGGDRIVFANAPGVVNMGKTYGRICAARASANGATLGTTTAIGIGLAATTAQAESVDSAILTSSDRVQLLWTRGNATAGSPSDIYGRCVKSSDNLDGTSPATAEYRAAPINGVRSSVAVDDAMHLSGQPFFSGSTLAIPYIDNSAKQGLITGTDADSMTFVNWGSISTNAISALAAGTSDAVARIGGSPWDGSNKNVVWIDGALADPMYDKDTFGTDQTIEATTATFVSANVYQRGSSVVIAVVYDKAGTWVYNEVVLRTVTTVTMPVQPMIPALASQQAASM